MKKINLKEVTIRISGDSGDGVQLIGQNLANTTAFFGNDIGTLPDFPAEIRAPMGSLSGVSGFQIRLGSYEIHTAGDEVDALIAMNPAALKTSLSSLKKGGVLIVNTKHFDLKGLKFAGYETNPLEDGSVSNYQTHAINLTELVGKTLKELDLSHKASDRCKNFFALGMLYWLYNRDLEETILFLKNKFEKQEVLLKANLLALKGGYAFCDASDLFQDSYQVNPVKLSKGTYKNINGNEGIALGLIVGAKKANLNLYYASYPITPASDLLHYLSKQKQYNVKTFQAEDEIAAVSSAIGASYAGSLGACGSSGPGILLKQEAINLAIMTELPLVIVNIQRAGPSTGMPTKTEQSDLLMTLYGRNGDSPIPVLATSHPGDCFEVAIEAAKIALETMSPVFLLSDGYIGNGSAPWKIPDFKKLAAISTQKDHLPKPFKPYIRHEKTLSRYWAIPGQKGFEHRIGGIEKEAISGEISYDPTNHDLMTKIRYQKIKAIQNRLPKFLLLGKEKGDVLVIGWGSPYGSIRTAVEALQKENKDVSWIHLKYLNPLPKQLKTLIKNFKHILIPEINQGQLSFIIKAKFLREIQGLNLVRGLPFQVSEIKQAITNLLKKASSFYETK